MNYFLELFSKEESLAFLKESMKKRKDTDDELNTLSVRLGYLPLALELASRYLNGHSRLNVTAYLEQSKEALEHPSMKGWRADLPAPTQHDLDLQRTFALSWQALKDETAQKMFQMAGYLAPNTAIPLEIFERTLEISSNQCDEVLTILYGLGLLRENESLPTIHPLLANYARGLVKGNTQHLAALADTVERLSIEANNSGLPSRYQFIKPHMSTLATLMENVEAESAGGLWNTYARHLRMMADYDGAVKAYNSALTIRRSTIGEIHQDTATTLNDLGGLLMDRGNYAEAIKYFQQALDIYEGVFGKEHSWVATAVHNLGKAMKAQGNLSGARTAYERALKIKKASVGRNHPDTAVILNDLGNLFSAEGNDSEARKYLQDALTVFENTFGKNHPWVATAVNNLGSVLHAQGDLNGARTAYERALKIDEDSFGPDHPNVAIRVNNLGMVMKTQGDLVGARAALERALAIFKKFLPPDHPTIKGVKENLKSLEN